jgi:hypothetical protein
MTLFTSKGSFYYSDIQQLISSEAALLFGSGAQIGT